MVIHRDLYDIWFFLQMGVTPDLDTLASRLKKPEYSRLVGKADRFPGSTVGEFYEFLRQRVATLTDSERKTVNGRLSPARRHRRFGRAIPVRSSQTALTCNAMQDDLQWNGASW